MESKNRKEIRLGIEKIDRISELHDSILSKILSHLPTKYAVGTSILSTRWKNLIDFNFKPVKIDLDDSVFLNPNNRGENINYNRAPSVTFINFVDKLINVTLTNANSVDHIILHCDNNYGVERIVSWIRSALQLNVVHLDLKFHLKLHASTEPLFQSLNGCTTLVTLRLWVKKSVLKVPDDFSLPNLKTLDLVELRFRDEEGDDPVKQFMEGCPALEYLSLLRCIFWYDICIKCPLLKKLVIEGDREQTEYDLTLRAPNLEELIYGGFLATGNFVCDFKSLHMAHIDICPSQDQCYDWTSTEERDDHELQYFNDTAKIVACCSSTIRLYLSRSAIDALHYSSMLLPLFPNLTRLSLDCICWPILAHLLQSAPNLEQLIMGKGFRDYGSFRSFTHVLQIPPECLALHVKRIEFWVFEGNKDGIKLVEYFLKNGEVLQKLILHCVPLRCLSSNGVSILRRLPMLRKLSKTCQIECIME